jgi:hypothetical protein
MMIALAEGGYLSGIKNTHVTLVAPFFIAARGFVCLRVALQRLHTEVGRGP